MGKLKNKVAIVTGSGRGIGRAIAIALATEGAKTVVVSRTVADVERTAGEIESFMGQALPLIADVTNKDQVKRLVKETVMTCGGIDILVNNAGVYAYGAVENFTEENWDTVLDTNLKGPFLVTQAALPQMFEQGDGYIINIGANIVFERRIKAGWETIAAAKFGLLGFSRSLMASVEGSGVKVTVIHAGATNNRGEPPNLARNLRVEDIADLVVYLTTLPKHVYIREVIIETHDYAVKKAERTWQGKNRGNVLSGGIG